MSHVLKNVKQSGFVIGLGFFFYLGISALSSPAHAFCIYNKTPFTVDALQWGGETEFKGMKKSIKPGKNACCNWKNKGCNRSKKRDSLLRFKIQLKIGEYRQFEGKRTRSIYCGHEDSKKDKFRIVNLLAGSAMEVIYSGPADVPLKMQSAWFRVNSWNLDGKGIRRTESCHLNDKGWTPGDLL
ncbi:MAG: hypothetical protein IGS23_22965 [Rivularia sp. T60_A2020_040]|nr:hypothetical protein [Rivularia sp. T60_A2020_040]